MSKQIDERIVELRFDNKDFEKNAEQSMKTLEKLDEALDIDGGEALSGFSASITKVSEKFSVLEEVAKGALMNIGMRAEQAGEQLVKSLTIDQVSSGFEKYEEKTKAVQTIMNATGDSIDTVNGYLEKLMWFTDETSYNFVDMTSNIGKFTAQGIKLDKATTAMQGIATWAAKSGQGASEASRAMYNLSQSLGVGAVKLMDWMSIENANMATAEFKQLAIDTAKELGTLSKAAETAKGNLVTVTNFRENLSDEWFSADVLIATLEKYGDYADQLHELVEETGLTASEAMKILDQTYEGIGMSAFKAAQEAKTFTDAIEATKDAVSTGWLQTFEIIFGNYEEAKVLWTDLANGLYDVFASGAEGRNELLGDWHEMGGREELIEGITQACRNLVQVLDLLGDAWSQVFPKMTADRLFDMTVSFRRLMENLQLTETAYNNLRDAISGILSVFKLFLDIVGATLKGLFGITGTLNQVAGAIVGLAGEIGRYLMALTSVVDTTENMNYITASVAGVMKVFGHIIEGFGLIAFSAIDLVNEAFSKLGFDSKKGLTGVQDFINVLKTGFASVVGEEGFLADFFIGTADAIGKAMETLAAFANFLSQTLKMVQKDGGYKEFFASFTRFGQTFEGTQLGKGFKDLGDGIGVMTSELGEFFKGATKWGEKLNKVLDKLREGFGSLVDYVVMRFKELSIKDIIDATLIMGVVGFLDKTGELFEKLTKTLTSLKDIMKPWNDTLGEVQKTLKTYQTQIKAETFLKLATAIAILAGSLWLLSSIPIGKLIVGGTVLVTFAAALTIAAKSLEGVAKNKKTAERLIKIGEALILVSAAVGILSLALSKISEIDYESLGYGTLAITALITELGIFATAMSKLKVKISPKDMAGIATIALGLRAMVAPLKALASLPIETLKSGLKGLAVLLTEIGVFMALTKNSSHVLSQGAGITVMAIGLLELVGVLKLLSMMSVESLTKSLISLGVLLGELAISLSVLSKFSSGTGVAVAALLPVIALAIGEFVATMVLLGNVPLEVIGKGLLALGGAMAVLVATAAGVQMFSGGLATLGVTLTSINLSIAAVVGSFALFAASLPIAAAGIASFALISGETINKAFDNITTVLRRIIMFIASCYAEFKLASVTVFAAILDALAAVTPHILNGLRVLIDELLNFLIEYGPTFCEKLIEILRIINDFVGEFTEVIVDFVSQVLIGAFDGLANNLGPVLDALDRLLWAIVDWIIKGINGLANELIQAGKNMLNFFVSGFTGAAASKKDEIQSTTEQMGKTAVAGLNKGIDAHSPSKETEKSGENFTSGFLGAISNKLKSVGDACKNLGSTAVQGFNDGLFGKKTGVEDLITGIKDTVNTANPSISNAASTLSGNAADTAIKTANSKNIGKTVTEKAAKEVDEDEKLKEAAKKKAEEVANVFSDEFTKISSALSNIGYEFDIWKALQGPEAKDSVIQSGELSKAEKELKEYAKQYQIAFDNYQYLIDNPDLVQSPTELVEKQETYMKYLAEMYKKAADIAQMQKEMSDEYKAANELAEERLRDLQNQQVSLIKDIDFEFSDETKDAYNHFLNAATEEAKQQYLDIWKELKNIDLRNAGAAPVDADQVRRDVYKELGLDPNNAMQGYINVEETVRNLVSETSTAYLQGLELAYPTLIGTYGDIVSNGTEMVVEDVKYHYPEFKLVGERMVESTQVGMTEAAPKVAQASVDINAMAIEETNRVTPEWSEVGEGMMAGIEKGILDGRSKVIDAAVEVAVAALKAAKQALGIASPSKEFMKLGEFSTLGFVMGLLNDKDAVEEASNDISDVAVKPIKKFGSYIQDLVDDMNPVMIPILDLSQAESSLAYLNEMMGDTTGEVLGSISNSEAARRAESYISHKKEPTQVVYNESFTQNNYSPKALSAIEIYRQTNNQLARGRRVRT